MPQDYLNSGAAEEEGFALVQKFLKNGTDVPPLGESPQWTEESRREKDEYDATHPLWDDDSVLAAARVRISGETSGSPAGEGPAGDGGAVRATGSGVGEEAARPGGTVKLVKGCRIGIDAGSKTIKLVVLDDKGDTLFSAYHRHRLDIRTTLLDQINNMLWRQGDFEGTVAVTGSAGIAVAEMLGLPFVQEVIATTLAVQTDIPQADCILELGGEDAKVIYLTGGLEQRMNATCAGGTGGFIDTMASMLGERSSNMNYLALGGNHIYPIASRCAVFAQTDVRPLLNAGASKYDIAASAHEAVVRQAIGGLACGRPIRGNVVFLGGPLEHISDLVTRFRRALHLNVNTGIKPKDAHLFTAKGAAYYGGAVDDGSNVLTFTQMVQRLENAPDPTDDMDHLPPLFDDDAQREEFEARHRAEIMPRRPFIEGKGPFYLGVDAGSTAVKIAVVDSDGYLVHSEYHAARGKLIKTAAKMLVNLHLALPSKARGGSPEMRIAHATATGYGEELLRAAVGIDSGVVETTAHLRAAQHLRPDVSFVFDIGGQDMKAMWVRDGAMADVVLNEACSSGCGSFVSGIARSLKMTQEGFANEALAAKNPIDLGTKCTVFMNSRVRHAQKVGATYADIAAGVAYSVVYNALYRIIGRNKSADLGKVVVAQGGAFKSDAVLRAFEKVSGVEVVRPNTAHIMGAIGAALVARERGQELAARAAEEGNPYPAYPVSNLLSQQQLRDLDPEYRSARCPGCDNKCPLSIVTFENGRHYITGNRCDRAQEFVLPDGRIKFLDPHQKWLSQQDGAHGEAKHGQAPHGQAPHRQAGHSRKHERPDKAPNVVKAEQRLIKGYADVRVESEGNPRGACAVGLMNTLHGYEATPFWHTLLRQSGFSVLVPTSKRTSKYVSASAESVPSESVCQPAKLTHARMYELADQGAAVIFMPRYNRALSCPVQATYSQAACDSVPFTAGGDVVFAKPLLEESSVSLIAANEHDCDTLFSCLADLAAPYQPLGRDEFDRAMDAACKEQASFEEKVHQAARQALDWVHGGEGRHEIVLVGRAYHMDPDLLHGIDEVLEKLDMAVLPQLGLQPQLDALSSACQWDGEGWSPAQRLEECARFAVDDPDIDLVALRSFNCGFDAVSCDVVREVTMEAHRPFTELKIDDIVDTAHIRIRLRTLAEAIETRKRAQRRKDALEGGEAGSSEGARREGGASNAAVTVATAPITATGDSADGACVLSGGSLAEADTAMGAPTGPAGGTDVLPLHIGREDLEVSRSKVTSDLCFTAAALVAHAVRFVQEHPGITALRVPRVCQRCLVDSLPGQVKRICGYCPDIEWVDALPQDAEVDPVRSLDAPEAQLAGNALVAPRIGIVGNPLLCFDSFMNEHLVDLLESLGCQVVLPDPAKLFVDDVRYLDQLDEFAAAGVDHVIYLQSFSCLKGHVQARGAQREFSARYPHMPITVLDYDPESSALNRENRIRLAVHSVSYARKNPSGCLSAAEDVR